MCMFLKLKQTKQSDTNMRYDEFRIISLEEEFMIQVIQSIWSGFHAMLILIHQKLVHYWLCSSFHSTTEFKSRLLLCMLCVWYQRVKRQKNCNIVYLESIISILSAATSCGSCFNSPFVVWLSTFPSERVYFLSSRKKIFVHFLHLYKWSIMYNTKVAKFRTFEIMCLSWEFNCYCACHGLDYFRLFE